VLANLGEGWREPGDFGGWTPPRCAEPSVLLRREVDEWPSAQDVAALAFEFGDWIEDGWGMRQRRYLAERGDRQGQFDISRYGR